MHQLEGLQEATPLITLQFCMSRAALRGPAPVLTRLCSSPRFPAQQDLGAGRSATSAKVNTPTLSGGRGKSDSHYSSRSPAG